MVGIPHPSELAAMIDRIKAEESPKPTPEVFYSWSADGGKSYTGQHPTREEALAEGRSESPVCEIWTGRGIPLTVAECLADVFDADIIVEEMEERGGEEVGEAIEDRFIDPTIDQGHDLEERLKATVIEWAAHHKLAPTCWRVVEVERHREEY